MFQYLYEWAQNLAFYMVLVTVALHAVPDSGYKKYIRFFTGMVLILMIVTPIFRIFGMDSQIVNFYKSREYEAKLKEIEEATDYLNDIDSLGILEGAQQSTGAGENTDMQKRGQEERDYKDREAAENEKTAGERKDNSIKVEEIQVERDEEAD